MQGAHHVPTYNKKKSAQHQANGRPSQPYEVGGIDLDLYCFSCQGVLAISLWSPIYRSNRLQIVCISVMYMLHA